MVFRESPKVKLQKAVETEGYKQAAERRLKREKNKPIIVKIAENTLPGKVAKSIGDRWETQRDLKTIANAKKGVK